MITVLVPSSPKTEKLSVLFFFSKRGKKKRSVGRVTIEKLGKIMLSHVIHFLDCTIGLGNFFFFLPPYFLISTTHKLPPPIPYLPLLLAFAVKQKISYSIFYIILMEYILHHRIVLIKIDLSADPFLPPPFSFLLFFFHWLPLPVPPPLPCELIENVWWFI